MRKPRTPRNCTEDEHVVTAWAAPAHGPGWSNTPVWVLVRRNGTSQIRIVCVQPTEQNAQMWTLYYCSAAAHTAMCAAVEALQAGK